MCTQEEPGGGDLVENEAGTSLTTQQSQKEPNGHLQYLFVKAALGQSGPCGEAGTEPRLKTT